MSNKDYDLRIDLHSRNGKTSEGKHDEFVLETLNHKRNGYFVDCGAAHWKDISNSYKLESEYGWNGICIEPNQHFLKGLQDNRKCTVLGMAVSDKTGKEKFRQYSYGSSLDRVNFHPTSKNYKMVDISCDTLDNILEENNSPFVIDYLDLDIPGSELLVIQTINFTLHHYNVITVKEIPETKMTIQEILLKNGFVRKDNLFIDMCFVNERIL